MRFLKLEPRIIVSRLRVLALIAAGALLLAGCETTSSPSPAAEAAKTPDKVPDKAPDPPMTHSRAAQDCWMKTEKGNASADLDKRADAVNKCIDEKMKAPAAATPAPAAPKS